MCAHSLFSLRLSGDFKSWQDLISDNDAALVFTNTILQKYKMHVYVVSR